MEKKIVAFINVKNGHHRPEETAEAILLGEEFAELFGKKFVEWYEKKTGKEGKYFRITMKLLDRE